MHVGAAVCHCQPKNRLAALPQGRPAPRCGVTPSIRETHLEGHALILYEEAVRAQAAPGRAVAECASANDHRPTLAISGHLNNSRRRPLLVLTVGAPTAPSAASASPMAAPLRSRPRIAAMTPPMKPPLTTAFDPFSCAIDTITAEIRPRPPPSHRLNRYHTTYRLIVAEGAIGYVLLIGRRAPGSRPIEIGQPSPTTCPPTPPQHATIPCNTQRTTPRHAHQLVWTTPIEYRFQHLSLVTCQPPSTTDQPTLAHSSLPTHTRTISPTRAATFAANARGNRTAPPPPRAYPRSYRRA